jgi:DNA-binding response OmpR family regulator
MKVFPSFRLDAVNQCVWRLGDTGREERILLTPKAFAVLAYLVDHAGRLVTHDELLEAVWPAVWSSHRPSRNTCSEYAPRWGTARRTLFTSRR